MPKKNTTNKKYSMGGIKMTAHCYFLYKLPIKHQKERWTIYPSYKRNSW